MAARNQPEVAIRVRFSSSVRSEAPSPTRTQARKGAKNQR
jgi:hypothetical protein